MAPDRKRYSGASAQRLSMANGPDRYDKSKERAITKCRRNCVISAGEDERRAVA
jgi:hypothetical protein